MEHKSQPPITGNHRLDQAAVEPLSGVENIDEVSARASTLEIGAPATASAVEADDETPTAAAVLRIELVPYETAPWMNTPVTTPEEAVEAVEFFLESQAGLIAKSRESWQAVKAGQASVTSKIAELQLEKGQAASKHQNTSKRQSRRDVERNAAAISYRSVGHRRNLADLLFRTGMLPQLKFLPDQEAAEDKAALEAIQQLADNPNLHDMMEACSPSLAADITNELATYMKADYYDGRLIANTRRFLGRKPLVPIFLDRLMEMGELAPKGIVEYPGYLEVLGTHEKKQQNAGIVAEAARSVPVQPEEYANEFMQAILNNDVKVTKNLVNKREMGAAIEVMRFIGSHIMSEFEVEDATYVERLSSTSGSWPHLLQSELKRFATNSATQSRQDLETMLGNFARRGRLPATGRVVAVNTTSKQTRTAQGRQARRTKGSPQARREGETVILETAAKGVAMDDLVDTTGETGREPIKHFAVLRSTGSSSGKLYRLEPHADLDSIMACNEIHGYIEAHNGTDNLEANIRIALERVTLNPNDLTDPAIKRLQGIYFSLQELAGKQQKRALQRARQISLQHFPGVSGGGITAKTRIIYGLVRLKNTEGEEKLVLAIHGAFVKQDLDGLSGTLPKR